MKTKQKNISVQQTGNPFPLFSSLLKKLSKNERRQKQPNRFSTSNLLPKNYSVFLSFLDLVTNLKQNWLILG